jgi:hypothetical protein
MIFSPATLSRSSVTALLASVALSTASVAMGAQAATSLPFAPGERFEYAGRVHVGVSGKGSIWVEGPTELRGTPTWTLHSEMEGKLGFLRATDKSASWLDPVRFASLRYTTHERHLLVRHDEVVDLFAAEKRWSAEGGAEGKLESDAPLDELSFLFYLRTLPLKGSAPLTVARHFDSARNPTVVTVVAHEEIAVGAGRFRAVIVEMRVRDERRYKGEGVIRIALSDDKCRLLLRLESDMPDAGKATLGLVSFTGTPCECTSQIR